LPKKKMRAADKQLQAEAKQVMNFYLELNAAGREFVTGMLAAANIPAYRKTARDITESQGRTAETRPAIREVDGDRRRAEPASRELMAPWANALKRMDLDHILPKGVDAAFKQGERYVFLEFKRAG
jgi:hypothetical protein